MSFDYFHTQPYLSTAIDSREDIETTVLLFLAALMVGGIATIERIARRREASAHHEVRRIYRVAEARLHHFAVGETTGCRTLVARPTARRQMDQFGKGLHTLLTSNSWVADDPLILCRAMTSHSG